MTEHSAASPIRKIVIAGGGTSGWLAAAAISKVFGKNFDITLVESPEIGRIGVGEATIPTLRVFHKLLGINEREFMAHVQGTFKLGIEFRNWANKGDKYFHSFGITGKECWACQFQHFWLAGKKYGIDVPFGDYCPESKAARLDRCSDEDSGLNYAYHLDATLYADFLKKFSQKHGANHVEGMIEKVLISPENGYIKSLLLKDGREIEGDLFLDCTGFKALLIDGALNTPWVPYGHYLPCDSAIALQTELVRDPRPYTQSIAHDFGWQWRIPLQHRAGNGLVYSSRHVSDDEAMATLMKNLEGSPVTEPRVIKYVTGRRINAWSKNCIAVGLTSSFIEPLESTSIHLAMSAIYRLMRYFPQNEISMSNVEEFNRQSAVETDRARDFVIMHYHLTQRADTEFWRYCKNMKIPEALANRVQLFKDTAAIALEEKELFLNDSWVQVMMGQGVSPSAYHPIADVMDEMELKNFLGYLRGNVSEKVSAMPSHQRLINHYCKAAMPA
ncbi:tryptophan halogenase family protein [Marinagarivorans cellulosilyticus]|uniref:Tryptophan 7-halogenase n=1 Tax=Marinagarivorans cellulosilyticus TaxID=2721545 RepID=A0AAN1WG46_9GAMM|nr:tryptophan halogenase family protein [Marinagarivorans cellulosilyticus]BCD96982.1 tryptophan 7-halogenase [Marinagarivorans cellulosilyticus]